MQSAATIALKSSTRMELKLQGKRRFLLFRFCFHGLLNSRYLALTETYLYIIRKSNDQDGYGSISARQPLETVVQITSKKRCPEIITFRYSDSGDSKSQNKNSVLLDKPFDVIRMVKQQIVKILEQENYSS